MKENNLTCVNASFFKIKNHIPNAHVLCCALMLVAVTGLSACGNKDKRAGQTLARVNGEEITILQINDELNRADVQAEQQEAASKKALESLIDRQLILAEAMRNKIDRNPEVMQAIERAKAQIIVQTYLQNITSQIAKPSKAEIDDYFQKNPAFFSNRKEFDLEQLIFASSDYSDPLKSAINSAKSLGDVAEWMDSHGVRYAHGRITRSTSDLPQQAVEQLMKLPKGQLFLVSEGSNRVLNRLVAMQDNALTATNAAPQIEQFLYNKKLKEAAEAEVAHLRSTAKIEYLNTAAPAAKAPPAGTQSRDGK